MEVKMKKLVFTVFFLFIMVGVASAFTEVSTVVSNNGVTGVVTCSSVAQQVVPAQAGRFTVGMVNNDATNTVYWGYTAAVTSSTGIPIYAKSMMIKDRTKRAIYCVTANPNTVDLRYYWE
jgi:putative hemolysin